MFEVYIYPLRVLCENQVVDEHVSICSLLLQGDSWLSGLGLGSREPSEILEEAISSEGIRGT